MLGLMSWALFLAVIIWGEAWERITGRETYHLYWMQYGNAPTKEVRT